MRPTFRPRVLLSTTKSKRRPNNKAEAKVAFSNSKRKSLELEAAIEWCNENNSSGYMAIKSGLFPLIKHRRTIDIRLKGSVVQGQEKQYCSILTADEEETLVTYAKNKNRCYQGINKMQLTNLIIDVLRIREHTNKKLKGGRGFKALSKNAKNALENNR